MWFVVDPHICGPLQKKIRDGFKKAAEGGETPLVALPKQKLPASAVRSRLQDKVSHLEGTRNFWRWVILSLIDSKLPASESNSQASHEICNNRHERSCSTT